MRAFSGQGQLAVVLVIVVWAIGYLMWRARKAISHRAGTTGCGSCGVAQRRLTVKPLVTLEIAPPSAARNDV